MNKAELRIGNYIHCALNEELRIPETGIIRTVDAILPFGKVIVDMNCHTPSIECPIIHCSGIPLTEEWFLKFGFDSVGYYGNTLIHYTKKYKVDGREHKITFIKYPSGQYAYTFHHHINYVHQLQNLHYALTGEELTIKPN